MHEFKTMLTSELKGVIGNLRSKNSTNVDSRAFQQRWDLLTTKMIQLCLESGYNASHPVYVEGIRSLQDLGTRFFQRTSSTLLSLLDDFARVLRGLTLRKILTEEHEDGFLRLFIAVMGNFDKILKHRVPKVYDSYIKSIANLDPMYQSNLQPQSFQQHGNQSIHAGGNPSMYGRQQPGHASGPVGGYAAGSKHSYSQDAMMGSFKKSRTDDVNTEQFKKESRLVNDEEVTNAQKQLSRSFQVAPKARLPPRPSVATTGFCSVVRQAVRVRSSNRLHIAPEAELLIWEGLKIILKQVLVLSIRGAVAARDDRKLTFSPTLTLSQRKQVAMQLPTVQELLDENRLWCRVSKTKSSINKQSWGEEWIQSSTKWVEHFRNKAKTGVLSPKQLNEMCFYLDVMHGNISEEESTPLEIIKTLPLAAKITRKELLFALELHPKFVRSDVHYRVLNKKLRSR